MSLKKYFKKEKLRRAKVLAGHLERMGAAFCEAVKIDPREAVLVSKEDKDKNEVRYWYERAQTRANIDELHPDIRELFQIAFALDADWEKAMGAGVDKKLKSLMDKYKVATEEDEKKDVT
jgi:hypothetical protein